jgi:hypothetical protein
MRDLKHIFSERSCRLAVVVFSFTTTLMLGSFSSGAQEFDMRWIGGYAGSSGDPAFGGNKSVFAPPLLTQTLLEPHLMNISAGVAVMTAENDSIFAYTNGWHLADASHQPMLNGGGLNPSTIVDTSWGLHRANSQLLLPRPEYPEQIIMVHMAPDAINGSGVNHSARLYYTLIDKDLNDGRAGVVNKNNVILEEPLLAGGLSAVRHANGRDWWVLTHGIDSDEFISFILTPYGFEGPFYQSIGTVQIGSVPCASFSPNGDRLAYTGYETGLDVFDFDRCTGILSNWQHADITDGVFTRSVQFSSDGSLIYVSSVDRVYQYNVIGGIIGLPNTVAVQDGFYDQYPGILTRFATMSLAPDGRIYISTGNTTRYMHVIQEPDEQGLACNLMQHAHYRQTWTANSIPYRPNYLLGPVDGSVCDSLGISLGVSDMDLQSGLRAEPNPSDGLFMLRYKGLSQAGRVYVRDQTGRLVLEEYLPPWSTVHEVYLSKPVPGIYHCTLRWGERAATTRIVVAP